MAVTKILARKGRLDVGVRYVLNGDKTNEQILTASQGCSTEHAVSRMMKTKQHYRQTDGIQYYHIIQSFKPGEVTPELALEIAREFAVEHLSGYEAVIGVHVDKEHTKICTGRHPYPPYLAGWDFSVWEQVLQVHPLFGH